MRSFALLIPLLSLGGCGIVDITADDGPEPSLFVASAMRIHPIFTEVKDWTGDGKPDGVEVLLEFQDRFGDPTKAAGTVMFELYEYRGANPDPRGARLANPWLGSIATLGEQQAQWNRTSRTYAFQLAYPNIEERRSHVLTAMFRSSEGGRFFDRVVLVGATQEPPRVDSPATRPAE